MEKIKTIWAVFKKNWITVWLFVAVLSFVSVISYAAYTRVTVAKRVISTGEGAGVPFASDLMSGNVKMIKRMPFQTVEELSGGVSLNIFNYPFPKRTSCGIDATTYNLNVTLGKLDAANNFQDLSAAEVGALDGKYSVENTQTNETYVFGSDNLSNHTFEDCSIAGGNYNSNLFKLYFDPAELTDTTPKNYCIKVEAVPQSSELPTLTGYVLVKYIKTADSGWIGELENLVVGTEYDGYNYIIKGVGKGRFTFKWNADKVTINQKFLHNSEVRFYISGSEVSGSPSINESDIAKDGDGFRSLTVVVDSSKTNRYDVQFFKVENPPQNAADYDNTEIEIYLPRSTEWEET